MISVWPKFYSFDPEMVLHFHFTFKPFPGHAQKRERESERKREREKERRKSREPLLMTDRAKHRADRDLAFAPIAISRSVWIWWIFFFFWVLFVFLYWGMNDVIYSFGNWENVRKCEQQVENVFSMVLSRTQPNIRKYFSKHFLKCNQTHENIFLSGK